MKTLLSLLMIPVVVHAQSAVDVAASPVTFAVCKTVDVLSTAYLLNSGIGYETNPIVAQSLSWGLGYLPLIAASYGVYRLLAYANNPVVTMTANGVTCGVAASNLLLIP